MKKFLLIAMAVLTTASASAINHKQLPKAQFAQEKKAAIVTPGAFKDIATKMAAQNSFYSGLEAMPSKAAHIKASRRAEVELIPTYSQWTYFYSTIMGGFIPQIMSDRASFLVADGKAWLAPFANLGAVEGVKNDAAENPYAEYGAEVYTFTVSIIATYTDPETGVETELTLEPCYIENYTPYRSGEATFNAYYFPENEELYIPSDVTLALFEADGTGIEVFDEYYVARRLDLLPQDIYTEYMSKATFTDVSYYGAQYNASGDCKVFFGEDCLCVQGADPEYDGAWVEYDMDETDNSIYTVMDDLYIATFNFYDDASRTSTHPGVVVTVGLLQSGGQLTAFTADYSSSYKFTDNADGTSTLANTSNTVYGDYVFEDEAYGNGGMMNAVDQIITITYEPIETAIKTISTDKTANADVTYNLNGQRVNGSAKGLVIRNGKKFVNK